MENKAAFKNNVTEESKTDIYYSTGCWFCKIKEKNRDTKNTNKNVKQCLALAMGNFYF